MRRMRAVAAAVLVIAAVAGVFAQRGFRGGGGGRFAQLHLPPNVPYDGRFAFVRVKYETAPGGYWWRGQPSWSHGYPLAEQNLMKIMNELSFLNAHEEINTLALDDPELFKYPLAYIIEVSWWTLTDAEAAALRLYLQKGGFLIVDDFKRPGDFGSPGWEPFEANMRRVLPDVRFFDMQATHPIFHAFFEINRLDVVPQAYNAGSADLPRRVRGQRSEQAAPNHHQLQHRCLAVLGMVRSGTSPDRSDQRGVQARRQLPGVRPDALDAFRLGIGNPHSYATPHERCSYD